VLSRRVQRVAGSWPSSTEPAGPPARTADSRLRRLALAAALAWCAVAASAQAPPTADGSPAISAEPSGQIATLTFFNRPIVVLRARVLGRGPAERADGAAEALADLLARRITGPVESRSFHGASLVTVGGRGVVALTPPDVDELSGETVEGVTAQTVVRLRQVVEEAANARAPGAVVRSVALAALGIMVGAGLISLIGR